VSDQGIGIPADALAAIFAPRYRAENVPPLVAGSGLGLASVCRMVAAEGGTIGVRSRLNVGSCFTLRLPLRAGAAQATKDAA
jgi:signal transduction histidine kinase